MKISKELENTLERAYIYAKKNRNEYITLEHVLFELSNDRIAANILLKCGIDLVLLKKKLREFISENFESIETEENTPNPKYSLATQFVLQFAAMYVQSSEKDELNSANVLAAMFQEKESHAVYFLKEQGLTRYDVLRYISHNISKHDDIENGKLGGTVSDQKEKIGDPLLKFCTNLIEKAKKG